MSDIFPQKQDGITFQLFGWSFETLNDAKVVIILRNKTCPGTVI